MLSALGGAVSQVNRDGQSWLVGTAADVAWIRAATPSGLTITSAIPPVFDDYATVELPKIREDWPGHDQAGSRCSVSSRRISIGGLGTLTPAAPT
jgi:hypothetical protein